MTCYLFSLLMFFLPAFWLGKYSTGEFKKNCREGSVNSAIWCDSIVSKQWIDWLGPTLWHPSPTYSGVQRCQKGFLTSFSCFFLLKKFIVCACGCSFVGLCVWWSCTSLVMINGALISDHPESRTQIYAKFCSGLWPFATHSKSRSVWVCSSKYRRKWPCKGMNI